MTYSESARGLWISYDRALRELARHGMTDPESIQLFHRECGKHSRYSATTVLQWLGY